MNALEAYQTLMAYAPNLWSLSFRFPGWPADSAVFAWLRGNGPGKISAIVPWPEAQL